MTLFVDDVEAAWLALNLATLVLTVRALLEVRADRRTAETSNGTPFRDARLIAAKGAVRSERIRLVIQALLLSAAIPSLAVDNDLTMLGPAGLLMLVAVLLLVQTFLDARQRRAIDRAIAARWRQASPS